MGSAPRSLVAVDLFGDLDLTLVGFLSETLDEIQRSGATDVLLSLGGLAMSSSNSLRALARTLATARDRGMHVDVVPGSRVMRSALSGAGIAHARSSPRPSARHILLARHAEQGELERSA